MKTFEGKNPKYFREVFHNKDNFFVLLLIRKKRNLKLRRFNWDLNSHPKASEKEIKRKMLVM